MLPPNALILVPVTDRISKYILKEYQCHQTWKQIPMYLLLMSSKLVAEPTQSCGIKHFTQRRKQKMLLP